MRQVQIWLHKRDAEKLREGAVVSDLMKVYTYKPYYKDIVSAFIILGGKQ